MTNYAAYTVPPQQGKPEIRKKPVQNQDAPKAEDSSAFQLAKRILRDQGKEQASRFLSVMEPFLAPEERRSIAERLNLAFNQSGAANQSEEPPVQQNTSNQQSGGGNSFNNLNQQMQMLQLLTQLAGQNMQNPSNSGGGLKGFDPMMLAQLLSSMNRNN